MSRSSSQLVIERGSSSEGKKEGKVAFGRGEVLATHIHQKERLLPSSILLMAALSVNAFRTLAINAQSQVFHCRVLSTLVSFRTAYELGKVRF